MLQVKKTTKIYQDINWTILITKEKYEVKPEGYDGYYEYWLSKNDYSHMMYVFGIPLKNWKEAEEYMVNSITPNYKRDYMLEIEKLEAENIYQHSNSCPLVDCIITQMMKGVNNGKTKSNAEKQGQEGLHADSKQH